MPTSEVMGHEDVVEAARSQARARVARLVREMETELATEAMVGSGISAAALVRGAADFLRMLDEALA